MHFFDLINQNYQELSEIDLQMGRYILDNPKQVQKMSAQEFAAVCLSSKSSAVRFAQKLGFTGFGELKNYLKWQNNEKEYGQALRFKKQLQDDIRKTLDYTEQSSWREIYSRLDACQMVYVIFTGVTQQSQAAELQRLLVLIGKGVQCIPASSQLNEFRRIMERLRATDLIFILSLSGENKHLQNIVNALSVRQAKIISITNLRDNWLSGKADFNLYAFSSRSVLPRDWWMRTAASFFVLIEAFIFGYVDYLREVGEEKEGGEEKI